MWPESHGRLKLRLASRATDLLRERSKQLRPPSQHIHKERGKLTEQINVRSAPPPLGGNPEAHLRHHPEGEEDEAHLLCTVAAMAPRDSNAHPPLQQRAKLPKPEASKVKGAVTRNAEPTTLPLSPVNFLDVASVWPGEPRLAETSTCLESHRPDENASKQLRATHQRIHNPMGKLTEQIKYYDSILKEHFVIKRAWLFRDPADPELLRLRDYHEIIKHPMDMKMVEENKDNREYDSAEEFARNMRLIFTICDRCNPPEHEVVAMVQELQTLSCDASLASRELADVSHHPLEDLHGITAHSDDVPTDCTTSCTASEYKRCELFMNLHTWNKILLPARVHLREVPGVRPELSLVSSTTPCCEHPKLENVQKALKCAHLLLNSHPCISTLDVSLQRYRGKEQQLLFKDLERASSVRYLRINNYSSSARSIASLSEVIPSMKLLEELDFGHGHSNSQLDVVLSTLLQSTMSLRVLRIQQLHLGRNAVVLLRGLLANCTLTELSFNEHLLSNSGAEYRSAFENYLEKSLTLTTLGFFGPPPIHPGESALITVLRGLLSNRTVRNLNLTYVDLNCESIRLITRLLERTESMRSFKLIPCNAVHCCDEHSGWIFTVARSNALQEVTLSVRLFNANTWRLFVAALSTNVNTMKVIIEADSATSDYVEQFCEPLVEGCMDERVSFSRGVSVRNLALLSCKALSSVFVFTEGTWENVESWPVLQQLSLCSHITSVRLSATWRNSEPLFTAISHYVEATVTLKELYLQMLCDADSREEDVSCWTIFSDSLSRNKSIRNVGIHRLGLYDEVSELLADAVKSRKDTWRVEFHNGAKPPGAFIRRLSEGITDNFALLNVTLHGTVPTEFVGDWLVVDEVVRRNSGLLTRAAQFVTGVLRDRYGAQALERVHDNPALQEEIMQVASVDSDEAASMIRRALRSIEDLHAFMALSGVVRERVVCLPRHDGRTQLDDLNEHCWARVRQYLLVEHVRYSGWPSGAPSEWTAPLPVEAPIRSSSPSSASRARRRKQRWHASLFGAHLAACEAKCAIAWPPRARASRPP
ncbi:hypothetical protein HPB48_022629 [Haemaphysalis longicornis]|uniref:Bromo domain-containing protein n=1 Tax=Haemaphysalis longicornis TaxID=44386 RepID=A0A9J6FRX9_HAELO|nr:hypothetical protein HPB48_022629 [Haemaphysalis longicornis]